MAHRWGGAAFALGNLLFLLNKLDDMARLFFGIVVEDIVSSESVALVVVGQVLLAIGYVALYRFHAPRASRAGRASLRLFTGGGLALTVGHVTFLRRFVEAVPFGESVFVLVLAGLLTSLVGLIGFGASRLRSRDWLPLATGVVGLVAFLGVRGPVVTPTFLALRTVFALGLIALGVVLAVSPNAAVRRR